MCTKLGDPTLPLTAQDAPIVVSSSHPVPPLSSATSVRVRVVAASLNYANYLQILGKYQEKPPLPFVPGSDYSGIVDAVGDSVKSFKVGDKVCSIADLGSFAQFIVTDHKNLSAFTLSSHFFLVQTSNQRKTNTCMETSFYKP